VKLPENFPLLFSWEPGKWLPGWLWLFVPVSALAHAASFFLFRVVYPNHPSLPSTPPRVVLLNNSLPEHAPLLQWIDTHNPALMAPPSADSAQLPLAAPAYRPSFQSIHTEPAQPPGESPAEATPPLFSPLKLLRTAPPQSQQPVPARRPNPTRVQLSTELQRRATGVPAKLASLSPARPMPSPRFLLGVTDGGAVRFIFLQSSSGEDALDQAAAESLLQIAFQPAPTAVLWGFATVEWGDPAAQGPKLPTTPGMATPANP
jgi:hypothetical protein